MIGETSFRRFMSLRQELFKTLSEWGEMNENDAIVKITAIFDSGGNCKGNSSDPYQKTSFLIEIDGENHDGFSFEGDSFDKLLDEFEEEIKSIKK